MKNYGPKILALRDKGYSYNKIVEELGCDKSLVCYHCGKGQKEKNKFRANRNIDNVRLIKKLSHYKHRIQNYYEYTDSETRKFEEKLNAKIQQFRKAIENMKESKFGLEELKEKITKTEFCELSGRKIDYHNTRSWHLDHKVPVCKGGDNSLENCSILCREANQAKHDMSVYEFIMLCKDILEHNGYKVMK